MIHLVGESFHFQFFHVELVCMKVKVELILKTISSFSLVSLSYKVFKFYVYTLPTT